MSKFALDTNVLLYLYDSSAAEKRQTSELLVSSQPFISTQVISEFINVTKRLQKITKREILEKCNLVIASCQIISVNHKILSDALFLLNKYALQIFDSIIVASSLEANCTVLYSEDLQHNQLIEKRLTIINPFL